MTPDTLAVVVNWRRPANIPIILASLRRQSRPVFIALVDNNADGTEFATPPSTRADADVVFAVGPRNLGPCCRFLPPLAMPEFKWTFFAVDDHVPGDRHVEYLHQFASTHHHAVCVGQDGRIVLPDGTLSRRRTRMHPSDLVRVDVITTSEIASTRRVVAATSFRSRMLELFGSEFPDTEDDLIFNFGAVNYHLNHYCAITPAPPSDAESWRGGGRLPSPHALCSREDHRERRDRFVRQAIDIGWRSRANPAAVHVGE